jgi:hypothetical protein
LPSKRSGGVSSADWQAAAAATNRQQPVRKTIVAALRELNIPENKWPEPLQKFAALVRPPKNRQPFAVPPFHPPVFDRLNELPKEWAKRADEAWTVHRDQFLERLGYWVKAGVDKEMPPPRASRGSGNSPAKQRRNLPLNQRYEWAALRLIGTQWKEIAARYSVKESTVIKAANTLINGAGWSLK